MLHEIVNKKICALGGRFWSQWAVRGVSKSRFVWGPSRIFFIIYVWANKHSLETRIKSRRHVWTN
jgi:hypothetical protein